VNRRDAEDAEMPLRENLISGEVINAAVEVHHLRLTGYRLGLLLNFNVPVLKKGIKRVVLGLPDDSSADVSARSAALR